MGRLALIVLIIVLFWSTALLLNEPRIFRLSIHLLRIRTASDFEQPIVSEIEVVVEFVTLRQWKDAREGRFLAFVEIERRGRVAKGNVSISPIAASKKFMKVVIVKIDQLLNCVVQLTERGVFGNFDSPRP